MKEKLPKICTSSTSKVLKCDYTICPYHIQHYDPAPENWVIGHEPTLDCVKRKVEKHG